MGGAGDMVQLLPEAPTNTPEHSDRVDAPQRESLANVSVIQFQTEPLTIEELGSVVAEGDDLVHLIPEQYQCKWAYIQKAFIDDPIALVLTESLFVCQYRTTQQVTEKKQSLFFAIDRFYDRDTARQALAFPKETDDAEASKKQREENSLQCFNYEIPAGTIVFVGLVASRSNDKEFSFDSVGGAYQVYLPEIDNAVGLS